MWATSFHHIAFNANAKIYILWTIMIKTDSDYICSITFAFEMQWIHNYHHHHQPSRPQFKCVRIRNKAQCYVNFSLKHSTTAASSAAATDQTLLKVRVCETPSTVTRLSLSHNPINPTSDFPQIQQPSTSICSQTIFITTNGFHRKLRSTRFFFVRKFTELKQKTKN